MILLISLSFPIWSIDFVRFPYLRNFYAFHNLSAINKSSSISQLPLFLNFFYKYITAYAVFILNLK